MLGLGSIHSINRLVKFGLLSGLVQAWVNEFKQVDFIFFLTDGDRRFLG